MRIRVTIDLGSLRGVTRSRRTVEVLLDAPSGATFAEVRAPIAHAAGLGDAVERLTFVANGKAIPPTSVVGVPPLMDGALIQVMSYAAGPAPAPPPPPAPGGLLELHVMSGPGAGSRVPLGRGTYLVGRARSCAVRLQDRGVSRVHARIEVSADGARVTDVEPSNPSLLQGKPLGASGAVLGLGDPLLIGSTMLVLRRVEVTRAPATSADGVLAVHRPPRFTLARTAETIAFPDEPTKQEGQRLPLLASLAPVVLAGALAAVMRSPMMLLFALMSPVMLLGQWLGDRRHGRVSHRRALARHQAEVERLRHDVAGALAGEVERRRAESPDLGIVGGVAGAPGTRLWERRPGDDDHLVARVGLGRQAARLALTGSVPDDLAGAVVEDVPVLVGLAAAGVVGIAGPRARVLSQAASIVLQLACWHSPRDLQLVVVTSSPTPRTDWEWASRLPHTAPLSRGSRTASVVSGAAEESRTLIGELEELCARRRSPVDLSPPVTTPSVVVVLDGAHDLRKSPRVAELLGAGPAAGIHWVCLDEVAERLPAETTAQIELDDGNAPRALVRTADGVVTDVVPDLPTRAWVEQVARSLAPLRDATPGPDDSGLPDRVGLRQLYAASRLALDPTDPDALVRHWQSPSRPRAALLGQASEAPFEVDLRRDGPHALVGGTTGAGKSELLRTFIAGLAVAHHPEELNLVLVDYKGGAAFRECARLPHTVGVVTDLDEHLGARALTSLSAELRRRERVLADQGAKDLDDYVGTRSPGAPWLPRLVIVVDEFKMLADELPEFVEGLVRLAAVGRSLGVHLVLATQRPGGIVSGDMRANIALRIALRVRDGSDSMDVVETPDAAGLSDRCPGRALVRTAGLELVEVQTAYAGGPLEASDAGAREVPAAWRLEWEDLATTPPSRPVHAPAVETGTELAALVEAARTAAGVLGVQPAQSPWLPPLPDLLPLSRLGATAAGEGVVPLGLVDRPTEQRQDLLAWDLRGGGHLALIGGARTGRTTTLRTLALSLAESLPPTDVHLHVLEGTPGQLRHLEALPHVGSVVGVDDPPRARRLVSRLLDEVGRRRSAGGGARPHIVLLVDGWETVEDAFESFDHGAPTEDLIRLLRDGPSADLSVAVTGGRALTGGRLSPLLQQRLVLAMADPLDLTLAGISPDHVPTQLRAGRAVDPSDGCQVQLAHAGTSPDLDDQDHAVAMAATVLALEYAALPQESLPWRIRPLPGSVLLDDLPSAGRRLPVGLGGDAHDLLGFDPSEHRHLVVAGPARSGRSTALAVLAHHLSQQGRVIAVITPRRSPLTQLNGIRGIHVLGAEDADAFIVLRRDVPGLAVLVDDADSLEGAPIETALLEASRLADAADGFIALGVDLHRATGLYRGLVPEVASHGTGLLLGARTPTDGELFRVRVDPLAERLPGRGHHLADGVAVPVQVADPTRVRASA